MSLHIFLLLVISVIVRSNGADLCKGSPHTGGKQFKYLWGDAFSDQNDCIGPTGNPYPTATINRMFRSGSIWGTSSRTGRGLNIEPSVMSPYIARKALLKGYELSLGINDDVTNRAGRSTSSKKQASMTGSCTDDSSMPRRLCKSRYNTTAPLYGVSLTSGQPVTIVQKFPDLLQQVVFEVCESSECEVVRGECTQTYVPYLFLVIPLGPVTLTGQDYVLVESGCVCRPQHGGVVLESAGLSAVPSLPDLS